MAFWIARSLSIRIGVEVGEGVAVIVGGKIFAGVHATKTKTTNKTPKFNFGFMYAYLLQRTAQRHALPALGRGRRSRPARKILRRSNCLGCAQTLQRQVHALLACLFFVESNNL